MRIYIRDDDVSYFTSPEEITSAYGVALKRGPVSFAVIPFAVKTENYGDSKAFRQDLTSKYPIHQNTALIDFLRDLIRERRAYIMLHGFNHIYYPCVRTGSAHGVPEFTNPELNFAVMLQEGRAYLEDTFSQKIRWFIPPSNALSKEAHEACAKLGFNLPYVFPFRLRKLNVELLKAYSKFKLAGAGRRMASLRLKSHTEVECFGVTKASVPDALIETLPHDAAAIFAHYWEVNRFPSVRRLFDDIVGKANHLGSFNELA